MNPLPRLSPTRFPLLPEPWGSGSRERRLYLSTYSVAPGLKLSTWEEFRPLIEAHRGLPAPWDPSYSRITGSEAEGQDEWLQAIDQHLVRVLPPPPRPPVQYAGDHWWVVYVGRVPGIYTSMYVLNPYTFPRLMRRLTRTIVLRFVLKRKVYKVPKLRYFPTMRLQSDGGGMDSRAVLW